jgi:hypothetical protein
VKEMKFGYYIVYGTPKPFDNPDAMKAMMEKFGKVLEKYGMRLKFWGGSFGTSEGFVYVMKGSMESYQSLYGNADYAEANPIATGQRTNMVLEF